jgi:hypothetical protein
MSDMWRTTGPPPSGQGCRERQLLKWMVLVDNENAGSRIGIAPAETAVRQYLTTCLWFRDRICCLSSKWLVALCVISVLLLAAVAGTLHSFLDDLTFLMTESDLRTALVLLELVLLASGSLWLLACCVAALGRRLVLQRRGL